jgi:RNA polymerase sigma-70 factor, ECF subfamily
MEVRESQIRDEHAPDVQVREENMEELQDVVARNLSFFHKRAYRYLGDPYDAEDAVQDAILSAYKHLDQFKRTAKMTTWLTSIVMNSALTQLRRRPRLPHISVDERIGNEQDYFVSDTLADKRQNPEGECIRSDLRKHLMQFVAELSPSLRKAIQLRDLDGLTTSETANVLGLTKGTVKSQLSRARFKLKQLMHGMNEERLT